MVTQGSFYREYVHVLTQQDVESEKYSLDDVILPVLGTTTIFPANSVADRSVNQLRPKPAQCELSLLVCAGSRR